MRIEGAVEAIDPQPDSQVFQRIWAIVHDLDAAIRFVELHMHGLGGLLRGIQGGVGLEIVMVELPDKAGLCRVTHPGEHAGRGFEHLRVAAFIHGAESFIVGKLALLHEVSQVANVPIALGKRGGKFIAALRAGSHIVLRPVVVDRLPIFLRHHALDRFDGWNGNGAGLGLEAFIQRVEEARRTPVVGAMRGDAASVSRV